jgi:hypothetical protein
MLTVMGKNKEALECFDKAIELDPKNSRAFADKDRAIQQLNQPKNFIV